MYNRCCLKNLIVSDEILAKQQLSPAGYQNLIRIQAQSRQNLLNHPSWNGRRCPVREMHHNHYRSIGAVKIKHSPPTLQYPATLYHQP